MSARIFNEDKLIIASQNAGKVREIAQLLAGMDIKIISTQGFDLASPEENGADFNANALLKAKYYSEQTGLPALADDSGLCVAALDGDPGIYSARWAENGDFTIAMNKIGCLLSNTKNTAAYFVCSLCLYWPDGHYEISEGKLHGNISFPIRGTNGFGYDPIFVPQGSEHTLAEMTATQKKQISHRSNAFNQLIKKSFPVLSNI